MAQENIRVGVQICHKDVDTNIKRQDFPSDFMFGVGSAAYQIEGGWNADGKGLSIWDCFALRHPEKIADGSNACVTIDSYHKMKEDVQLLKKMGVKYFRFSISWPRILPGGKVSMGKNPEGINYYNNLINELKANDIEPFATLFHWDLPNALEEEYKGFLSAEIIEDFKNYAEICFWEFGDRVKHWATFNEPYKFTYFGYLLGATPPGRGGKGQDGDRETEPYTVAYNLLKCHAVVYRMYQEDFKDAQKGQVGITLDACFYKPFSDSEEDKKAVEHALDFEFGWFMEPLKSGEWPESMIKQGRHMNALDKESLINSYDFLGINYYSASYVKYMSPSDLPEGSDTYHDYVTSDKDQHGNSIGKPAFEGAWVFLCANELVELLKYIKEKYKVEKHIIITENGSPDNNDFGKNFDGTPAKYDRGKTYEQVRNDTFRLTYIQKHLEAIKTFNTSLEKPLVMGYFVWSFTDSYEWMSGYTMRFGMIYVDYKNGLHRYPKRSAIWFKKFLSGSNKLGEPREPSKALLEQVHDVNDPTPKSEEAIKDVEKLKIEKA